MNKKSISQQYRDAYLNIVNNPNLSAEDKDVLVGKLLKSMMRATNQADRQLQLAKKLEKIDLDKVAGAEVLVAGLFPVVATVIITWGLGPVHNKALYDKAVEIMMDEVLKISAVGACLGLPTTIFEEKIKKGLQNNVEKCQAKKTALEEIKNEIELEI